MTNRHNDEINRVKHDSFEEGKYAKAREIEARIEAEAERLANAEILSRRILNVLLGVILVLSTIFLVILLFRIKNENLILFEDIRFYLELAGIVVPLSTYIIRSIVIGSFKIKASLWTFDKETIKKRKIKRLHKKYRLFDLH